jgi:hypothetical protein
MLSIIYFVSRKKHLLLSFLFFFCTPKVIFFHPKSYFFATLFKVYFATLF